MGVFWLGFVIGFLLLLAPLVVLALSAETKECDAQRIAREVREAKQQIDSIFADTKRKMEGARHMVPPKLWEED